MNNSVKRKPATTFIAETFSETKIGDTTAKAKTIFAQSKKNLAKLFLCDFVSFTCNQYNRVWR